MFPSPPPLEASCVLASTCSCPCHVVTWRCQDLGECCMSCMTTFSRVHPLEVAEDVLLGRSRSVGIFQSVEPDDRVDATLVMMGLGLALEAQIDVSQSVQNPFCQCFSWQQEAS